ncbi:armadillo-type protein [Mycena latifolia]|nr:armadillo-type protein [Mycena latifolia]
MPTLRRQRTLESVHSWWSDSNPAGPTISLHAATKPLMRLMYHRQALAFIKTHRSLPLSKETMEIYASYFAFKYVMSATKSTILRELYNRTLSQDDARTTAESPVLNLVHELLASPDAKVRGSTCMLLARLAYHMSTTPALLSVNPCPRLVSLLCDHNPDVTECAASALYWIARSPEGAEASVASNVFQCIVNRLASPSAASQRWACGMFRLLAHQKSTAASAVGQLLIFLRDAENISVIAAEVLYRIAICPEGTQIARDPNLLDCVVHLFECTKEEVRRWTCEMLGQLASQELLATAVLRQLVLLLRHTNSDVVASAAKVLHLITWAHGSRPAALDETVLNCVIDLLEFPHPEVQEATCKILMQLEWTDSSRDGISRSCMRIVALLRNENPLVVVWALKCLHWIARSGEGAQAAADPNVLGSAVELLESRNTRVREWTCGLLGIVAKNLSTITPVLAVEPCPKLVSLLRGKNLDVTASAAYALARIAKSPVGSRAVVDAKALNCVAELLASRNARANRWICRMVGELASHSATAAAVLNSEPCGGLVSLLRHTDRHVRRSAVGVLARITDSVDGVRAVASTSIFAHLPDLMESRDREIQLQTCITLSRLRTCKAIEFCSS